MNSYLFGVRNGVHIIDLQQTVPLLYRALEFVHESITSCLGNNAHHLPANNKTVVTHHSFTSNQLASVDAAAAIAAVASDVMSINRVYIPVYILEEQRSNHAYVNVSHILPRNIPQSIPYA